MTDIQHVPRAPMDEATPSRLSARLRLARQLRGMTLKAVADRAGCSESLLSKIENGKVSPSLPMLHRLVQALDTNIGWMFEEVDDGMANLFVARLGLRRCQPPLLIGSHLDTQPAGGRFDGAPGSHRTLGGGTRPLRPARRLGSLSRRASPRPRGAGRDDLRAVARRPQPQSTRIHGARPRHRGRHRPAAGRRELGERR
jgi:transcriptional regulator with XRE-family HTH domain